MKKPVVSAIAAIGAKNRVLGKDNFLLWKIPEDTKFFKDTTLGHPIIMGRKTFESFGARPLPNRENIIITRDETWTAPGIYVAHTFEEALEIASQFDSEEVFNIGGGQIYELGLPFTDRLYLTLIDTDLEGDAYFPKYDEFKKEVSRKDSSDKNFKYSFVVLEK